VGMLSVQTPAHVSGGMAEHTEFLARLLVQLGHEVTLVTTRHPSGKTREVLGGVETHYLAATRPGSQRGGWWRASARAFDELHRERPFDVVMSKSTAAAGITFAGAPPLVAMVHGTAPQMVTSLVNAFRAGPARWRSLPGTTRRIVGAAAGAWLIDRRLYQQ